MRTLIVPAGGLGTRLAHSLPKLLVPVAGRPMLEHLLNLYQSYVDQVIVVVNPVAREPVRAWIGDKPVSVAVQERPTGMLDAIEAARPDIESAAPMPQSLWITWCDQIAIHPATIRRLAALERTADLVLPTCTGECPYTHFQRDRDGRITQVLHRREGDTMPATGESDAGLFALSWRAWSEMLPDFARQSSTGDRTGERNFLPFIPWVAERTSVRTFPCEEPIEAVGINTPDELRVVEAHLSVRLEQGRG